MTGSLHDRILARLQADPKAESPWDLYVLASLEGEEALAAALSEQRKPEKAGKAKEKEAPAPEPRGAYLKSIAVEGFRGIGPKASLELPPGPGLTLVVGRNGSGKSSFAEGLELLLTGDTFRWKKPRTKVWREGWRSLHHKPAAIEAEFHIEGEKGQGCVARRWEDDAELDGGVTTVQIHGKPRTNLAELGWKGPLETYRPFLSYNELGSLLDEGPSRLYDALSSILGLDELTAAQEVLAEARRERERAFKEAGDKRTEILGLLERVEDDRARTLAVALQQKDWGLDAAEQILARDVTGTGPDGSLGILRQLAGAQAPNADMVAGVVNDLRMAHKRQQATAGTLAAKSKDLADILDQALRFHTQHGDGACPVCGKPKALDKQWHAHKQEETRKLRDAAREAMTAQQTGESVRRRAQQLPVPAIDVLSRAKQIGLDAEPALEALEQFKAGPFAELDALADHLEKSAPPLRNAVESLRKAAEAEIQKREDRWKPVAPLLAEWLQKARQARADNEAIKPLKNAEAWLKQAASDIRDERFQPIKERAQAVWNQLRLQSNVALDDIRLSGSATKRQVELDVTVDGVEGAALGVMSQGELHALALSLFIPRATLAESPFRFVVIDDPVQSMDPARVDGLGRVLDATAKDRQVVVFTHDDRLPEAVRRLGINATVREVTRREGSVVEVRNARDPVKRHLDDAFAVAQTEGLPPAAARRVIPGLCRLAIDAACSEAVRRRRLARGERHADVEEMLARCNGTKSFVSLALFDDPNKAGDVMPRLDRQEKAFADVYRMCNEGAHGVEVGARVGFIREVEKLARWLQVQK
jgi:recombinational DNA repair ATPase RecF